MQVSVDTFRRLRKDGGRRCKQGKMFGSVSVRKATECARGKDVNESGMQGEEEELLAAAVESTPQYDQRLAEENYFVVRAGLHKNILWASDANGSTGI